MQAFVSSSQPSSRPNFPVSNSRIINDGSSGGPPRRSPSSYAAAFTLPKWRTTAILSTVLKTSPTRSDRGRAVSEDGTGTDAAGGGTFGTIDSAHVLQEAGA